MSDVFIKLSCRRLNMSEETLRDILTIEDPIFLNYRALIHDYIPPHLPHREAELKEYLSIIKWLLKGEKVENVYIYGETGTGKTVVAKKSLDLLKEKCRELNAMVKIGYTKTNESPITTLYTLCRNLGLEVPQHGLSLYNYLHAIEEIAFVPTLLILDEFDKLNVSEQGWKLIHAFSRHPNISVTVISIRHDLCQFLPKDTMDGFRPTRIFFKTYTEQQLFNICNFRAELSLKPTAYDDKVIWNCAKEAYSRPESARFAIDMLRVGGEIARQSNATSIAHDHLKKAPARVEELELERMLFNLPFHHKLLLVAVYQGQRQRRLERDFIFTIFNSMLSKCEKVPVSKRTFDSYVQEMNQKRLVSAIRRGLGRGKGTTWFIDEGFYSLHPLILVLAKSPDLSPFLTMKNTSLEHLNKLGEKRNE